MRSRPGSNAGHVSDPPLRPLGRHKRGAVAGIGVLATGLAVWGLAPVGPAAAAPSSSAAVKLPAGGRFTKAPAGSTVTHKPLGLSSAKTTVIVELAGDPVTVADAEAAKPLTKSQRSAHRSKLRKAQEPAEAKIRKLGGTVLADYQSAYNGLKVRISQKQVAALEALPEITSVHRVRPVKLNNVSGVPMLGAPSVWAGTAGVRGLHGEGIKVAILDTGVDYTHADFGGPGTVAAYAAAQATETQPANPAWFGPKAPRVKGGIDLVGDSYNADPDSDLYQPVPHPDPNPLDCNGHGTHVAGTAAGSGVLTDGKTYRGPYNASTVSTHQWTVGPGVAPKADLYAVRVFGCDGSTDVVLDAIEWSVEHDMDVINMSLGAPFGSADSPDAVASSNAVKDGVIVVAASGNEGPSPYMSGSPASGDGVISVAASDPTPSYPGAKVALSTGTTLNAVNANDAALPTGALPVEVLMTDGVISLGCDPKEYVDAGVEGKLVVVRRGTCARVARAVFGQQAGAAAVLMINNVDTLPPFEGEITGNPDEPGSEYDVTIPFLGVKSSDGAALIAADGKTATLSAFDLENTGYLGLASFSSAGPRGGDSWLKPDVTAPGVSIFSAGNGTGNDVAVISGTSMASPFTAGVAALVKQAHPSWKRVTDLKSAIVNTADAKKVAKYAARGAGSGLVQAPGATRTQVVAAGPKGSSAINFGFAELGRDYVAAKSITVRNLGKKAVTFTTATSTPQGSPHTVTLDRKTVRVPGRGQVTLRARLAVPAATAGTSAKFADVAGLVTLTPTSGGNAGVALSVPYYLVPQATSNIATTVNTRALVRDGSATATTTNRRGAVTGVADWYAWGLEDGDEPANTFSDVKAVGVQRLPEEVAADTLAFGIATHQRWSTASTNEFDVLVDANRDGTDDYAVVGVDYGLVTAGTPDGRLAVAVFDLASGDGAIEFLADAPFNSTTLALPVLIEQLCTNPAACVSAANPRFDYSAVSFGNDGTTDTVAGTATFNAFSPSVTTGIYDGVAPNETVSEEVTFDAAEFAKSPALGFFVMSHDNRSNQEAQLIKVKAPKKP